MAVPQSGSDRRREASCKAILDATSDIISEKGIDGFTLSEIAKRAKINRALIYHYFGDRENLVVQAINHIVADYEPFPMGATIDDALIERSVRMEIENPVLPRFFFHLLLNKRPLPGNVPRLVRAIQTLEQLARGAPDAPVDPPFAVAIVTLAGLAWAVSREELASLLDMDVEEADARFIKQLQHAVNSTLKPVTDREN